MQYFDQVKLTPLMALTTGLPEIMIGLIDGPVVIAHQDFSGSNLRELQENGGTCIHGGNLACQHGTFVAGILAANRNSLTPGISPGCTLLIRPIFADAILPTNVLPTATPEELAKAIQESIDAGARVLNISAAIARPSTRSESALEESLNMAARRGVLVVNAAGNQGMLGGTAITRHPWVIPVIASNAQGQPLNLSNIGNSIGKKGLAAPGDKITSLGIENRTYSSSGTSAAAPFVTGTIALLWSLFPQRTAAQIKLAILRASSIRRNSVVPPLLDAWTAYQYLSTTY